MLCYNGSLTNLEFLFLTLVMNPTLSPVQFRGDDLDFLHLGLGDGSQGWIQGGLGLVAGEHRILLAGLQVCIAGSVVRDAPCRFCPKSGYEFFVFLSWGLVKAYSV